jgi:hypothetical protein
VWLFFERQLMNYSKIISEAVIAAVFLTTAMVSGACAEGLTRSVQLKAGIFFPESTSFDVGNGIDLVYSIKPIPYAALDVTAGYYRAERGDTRFLSAIPLTVGVRGIAPLPYVSVYAGGGAGAYYKMLQLSATTSAGSSGLTELPADSSEFSAGYYLIAGIEFPTTTGMSLLLDVKHTAVERGKFGDRGISHDGTCVYGGFQMEF